MTKLDTLQRPAEITLPSPDHGDALERIALALSSSLELREVLRALAGETLAVAGAGRTSVFLLADSALQPVTSRASSADDELWDAFQRMAPIPLTSDRRALLATGEVLVVDDPATICPPEWVERFNLRCLVLVPLIAGDEPCGLMSIDFPHQRRLDAGERGLLQAVGAFAGVAVRNARTYEAARRTARLQAGLADAAAALASPMPPANIAGRLCAAATNLLDARHSAVAMLDQRRCLITPLIVCGARRPEPFPFDELPPAVLRRLEQTWEAAPGGACVFRGNRWLTDALAEEPDATVVVLPLLIEGGAAGAAAFSLDARRGQPDAELLAVAEALAAIAGAALERDTLLHRQQQQLDRLDILYGLSRALAERADARRLVDTLNAVLGRMGVQVEGMTFRSRTLVRHLGGEKPSAEEKAVWTGGGGSTPLGDGTIAVPMRLGRRLVGSLRVRGDDLDDGDLAFLEALAAGVADVAQRGALRSSVEDAARERAIAAERDRIADDLHDTVGQQFVALGLMANRIVEQLPPSSPWATKVGRLAELAAGGKFELDQAVRALAFVPAARRGLVPAVRGLCRSLSKDSGLDIVVDVVGRPVRLQPTHERALYRVVHESLTNAWRHARCTTVHVGVRFDEDASSVVIRDDGVGLGRREAGDRAGNGTWSMRRNIAAVGGTVRIRNAKPRGVEVVATVARGTR